MPDTRLADVSEFQTVDWPAYSEPAVIIRVLYGTSHVDNHWAANIAGARANPGIRVRGIYHYIVAAQDITAQALAFVRTVGHLRPGEFVIADVEEGAGDLQARFEAWAQVVHAGLGGLEAEYSGSAFAAAHLEGFAGARFAWVAAYQAAEPGIVHQLWQYSDRQVFAGISAPCDASVFHGSIDQLYALVTGAPSSTTPGEAMGKFNLVAVDLVPAGAGDYAGRLPFYGTDPHGAVFAFNGAAPVRGLNARPELGPARSDVVGIRCPANGRVVLFCDDGHRDAQDSDAWAASVYELS